MKLGKMQWAVIMAAGLASLSFSQWAYAGDSKLGDYLCANKDEFIGRLDGFDACREASDDEKTATLVFLPHDDGELKEFSIPSNAALALKDGQVVVVVPEDKSVTVYGSEKGEIVEKDGGEDIPTVKATNNPTNLSVYGGEDIPTRTQSVKDKSQVLNFDSLKK